VSSAFYTQVSVTHTNRLRSTLKTIFDHVIGKILRLVEKQIDEVRDRGSDVKVCCTV
jgi:hypothetical protein